MKAPSELVVPPHLDNESIDSDADTPPLEIPTLGPDRPNLHMRPSENNTTEATANIAPIPSRSPRTNYIIAALCAAAVVGAAGVVLYSTLGGNKSKSRAAAAAVAEAQPREVAPTVTPIVEPIPAAEESPAPVASALPVVESTPAVERAHHTSKTRASSERAIADRATREESKPAAEESESAKTKSAPADEESKPAVAKTKSLAAPAADDTEADETGDADEALSEKPVRETKAAQPAAELGVLMLGSKPPCAIHIDGRDTGLQTPQRSIELAVGTHKVSLVNETYDIREKFSVKITSGEKTRVIKDMSDRLSD